MTCRTCRIPATWQVRHPHLPHLPDLPPPRRGGMVRLAGADGRWHRGDLPLDRQVSGEPLTEVHREGFQPIECVEQTDPCAGIARLDRSGRGVDLGGQGFESSGEGAEVHGRSALVALVLPVQVMVKVGLDVVGGCREPFGQRPHHLGELGRASVSASLLPHCKRLVDHFLELIVWTGQGDLLTRGVDHAP